MKIILIALPRTGSTSIVEYFKHTNKNFKTFSEPFNQNGKEGYYSYKQVIKPKNVFVKHLFEQIPKDLYNLNDKEVFEKIREDFDKIVFLDRKNIKEQSESLSKAITTGIWHTKYIYSEKEGHCNRLDYSLSILLERKENMITVQKNYGYKIFYYEDIFYNKSNMLDFLSEINSVYDDDNFNRFLNIEQKYRIEKKISGLI